MQLTVTCADCGRTRTITTQRGRKAPERCASCNYSKSYFGRRFKRKTPEETRQRRPEKTSGASRSPSGA